MVFFTAMGMQHRIAHRGRILRFAAGAACCLAGTAGGDASLQAMIDAAPDGAVLNPPSGRYAGGVVISKRLTLDGGGKVTVDAQGRGTVVTVRATGVTLRGLHLTGSGDSHDASDAGVLVESDRANIVDNRLDDVLFGIHLKQSWFSTVRGNSIRGRPADLNLRGDGIRLWNSVSNRVERNRIDAARDFTLANSSGNTIAGNEIRNGRYGMHLVFSPRNVVEDNALTGNTTGIAVIYSDFNVIRRNRILDSRDVAGAGLAFKESNQVRVEGNEVVNCTVGVQANAPIHPGNLIHFHNNRFAHNITGMFFYGEKGGHIVHGNRFEKNLVQVAVSGPTSARGNDWRSNTWDDYEGFDRDGDGVGDTPYELWSYADRIWMETPMARFFRDSPLLELLDFLEHLAPFLPPDLVLRDPQPRFERRLPAVPADDRVHPP